MSQEKHILTDLSMCVAFYSNLEKKILMILWSGTVVLELDNACVGN